MKRQSNMNRDPNNIFYRKTKEQKRVVITGMGCVSPLGLNLKSTWDALLAGKSGISKISDFNPDAHSVKIAGQVKDFNADDYIPKKEQKKMDRFIHLALASTEMALQDADIQWTDELKQKTGTLIGVGIGGLINIEKQYSIFLERGPSRVSPFFIPSVITNLASGHISIQHGFMGPNFSVTSACASGSHSIGEGAKYIRDGECEIMVCGGSEAAICDMAIAGFSSMKALSTRNDSPQEASRPWDQDRDGFVLSEGAAVLVLENYEHAAQRGARIYGELTGYGVSSDAHHMTTPSPGGEGASIAMKKSLMDAGLNPTDIDYINAHGTSTPAGDALETEAIKKVFEDHAKSKLLVSSTKSMTGHTLGAAGALESVFSLMALQNNKVPPTINLDQASPECDLDYVPLTARDHKLTHVLNNSFGFGGTNACLIFSEMD